MSRILGELVGGGTTSDDVWKLELRGGRRASLNSARGRRHLSQFVDSSSRLDVDGECHEQDDDSDSKRHRHAHRQTSHVHRCVASQQQ